MSWIGTPEQQEAVRRICEGGGVQLEAGMHLLDELADVGAKVDPVDLAVVELGDRIA